LDFYSGRALREHIYRHREAERGVELKLRKGGNKGSYGGGQLIGARKDLAVGSGCFLNNDTARKRADITAREAKRRLVSELHRNRLEKGAETGRPG